MAYIIVYVELKSMDSGCANDVSMTRVFNRANSAIKYYKSIKDNESPDAAVIASAEFRGGMLCPVRVHATTGFFKTDFEYAIERNQKNE